MTLPPPMFQRFRPHRGEFARRSTLAHHGGVPHAVIVGGGPDGAALADRFVRPAAGGMTLLKHQRDFAREFRGKIPVPSGRVVFCQGGPGDGFGALAHAEPSRVDFHPAPGTLTFRSYEAGRRHAFPIHAARTMVHGARTVELRA